MAEGAFCHGSRDGPTHPFCGRIRALGEVAEWSNVPDSKSGVLKGTVGSNPTLSAKISIKEVQE